MNDQSLHFIEVKHIQPIIKATTERRNYLLGSVPTLKNHTFKKYTADQNCVSKKMENSFNESIHV